MSVVYTNKWLREFMKRREETPKKLLLQLQNELLCDPIALHFEKYHSMQLHKYFLENGLFFPDADIMNDLVSLEEKKRWEILEKEYKKLKTEWNGVEAKTFLFPVEKRNKIIMEQLKGKMGISFHSIIVLFLCKEVSDKEVRALFTHEYNHVCRLSILNKEFQELSLLDSMLIEGMAEVAVRDTLGKSANAPWIDLHSKSFLLPYWRKVIPMLEVKGKDKHDPVLYGSSSLRGFPKWFGYSMGYHIIQSYLEKNHGISINELLRVKSEDILRDSDFSL